MGVVVVVVVVVVMVVVTMVVILGVGSDRRSGSGCDGMPPAEQVGMVVL